MKNLKKKFKGKEYGIRLAFGLLLCAALCGCGGAAENAAEGSEADSAGIGAETEKEQPDQPKESSLETEETEGEGLLTAFLELPQPYQQMAMYIQEGFRRYQVEGDYQAYFGPIEEGEDYFWLEGKFFKLLEDTDRTFFSCDILLESEGTCWREELVYEYDPETDWYIFASQYEPVFSKDIAEAEHKNSSYTEEILKNHVYEISIAREADMAVPIRYTSESGPVLRDQRTYYPWTFEKGDEKDHDYFVAPMSYSYWDERLDIDIMIQYVQISLHEGQEQLEDAINEKLREAFFYVNWEEQEMEPGRQIYSDIDRFYKITREDEKYLSMRIYDYVDKRGTAHPGEGEVGITIDMQTGEVLCLADVVGEEYTPAFD